MSIDIKTAELGQEFNHKELRIQCKAVWGGVSWPGKNPGFAVVIAMDKKEHFDNYNIYLLEEFESFDMRELVKQCGVLSFKYQTSRWIGDNRNDAADRFIREMNSELTIRNSKGSQNQSEYNLPKAATKGSQNQRRPFSLVFTQMLDMKPLYPFILYELRSLMDEERRQLVLKDSKIKNYMRIEESTLATLELGAFPGIEALAFAVIEMRRFEQRIDSYYSEEEEMRVANSYATQSVI